MKARMTRAARAALYAGVSAAAILTAPAVAQDDGADDRIVVTGSRIARNPNLGSPVPVESIDADELRLSGNPDVAATLIKSPALLTSTTVGNSIGGLFGSGSGETGTSEDGEAVLNLRGLGIERTLVLVDGRRHIAGVGGAAAVDVNTIPKGLIERVDVMTGGASAIYGADAVSGVVNFIMKKDFDGLQFDAQGGISGKGDGEEYTFSAIAGKNFNDGRGNITLAVDFTDRAQLVDGDRALSRDGAIASDFPNPLLRFQAGDISAASTPNFASFYDVSNGFFPTGFRIPVLTDAAFITQFGAAPTAAERALMDRASTVAPRAILPFANFSITSNSGVVVPANFDPAAAGVGLIDVNGNGIPDCNESFLGFNSLFQGSAFGAAGGCWNLNADGTPRIYRDGLIAGTFNQFGGDGATQQTNLDSLTPDDRKISANLFTRYDLTDNVTAFAEFKYVRQTTNVTGLQNSFWDLLSIEADNPFIPAALQPVADAVALAGGGAFVPEAALHITKDPIDIGGNLPTRNRRETWRVVGGFEGELSNSWKWEISGNYGRFNLTTTDPSRIIPDRFFAAIDVTTDGAGNPICESDIDPTPPATTPFDIPGAEPAFLSFTPGDGSCKPANIFGIGNISQAAIDFITQEITNEFELEQLVFSANLVGDTEDFFSLPGGPVGFAVGAEYRDEKSTSTFDPLVRGVIPVPTVFAPGAIPGQLGGLVSDLGLTQNSLAFDPQSQINNTSGAFDVWEVFGEISAPIVSGVQFFEDLTIDAAVRFSEYSTVGSTLAWKAGGSWNPVENVRFRGNYSKAVRAPNIEELFSPDQGAFFRPNDPCAQAAIDTLIAAGDPRGAIRAANCAVDGIPSGFVDPLSARFVGVRGGNVNLTEETATTYTVGVVVTPSWIEGLSLSADYWNITIDGAIEEVSANDIVSNCYDTANFPNQFCALFTRNRDMTSPQFLGFNFLRQTALNFGKIDTDGIDFTADYRFDIQDHDFALSLNGTHVRTLDNFFDPGDPTAVDPELGELQRPVWAGNVSGTWSYGPASVQWRTQYLGQQALRGVEIETRIETFGLDAGLAGRTFIHDLSVSFDVHENILVYGGVNNIMNELPFITEAAFPVSPVGRFFFLGASLQL